MLSTWDHKTRWHTLNHNLYVHFRWKHDKRIQQTGQDSLWACCCDCFLLFHCFDGWNIENIQDEKVNKQKIYLILSWCWPPIRLQYVSVLVSLSREKCSCNFWLWFKVSILSSRRQGNWCRTQTYWATNPDEMFKCARLPHSQMEMYAWSHYLFLYVVITTTLLPQLAVIINQSNIKNSINNYLDWFREEKWFDWQMWFWYWWMVCGIRT